jgi:hypothetical protein
VRSELVDFVVDGPGGRAELRRAIFARLRMLFLRLRESVSAWRVMFRFCSALNWVLRASFSVRRVETVRVRL